MASYAEIKRQAAAAGMSVEDYLNQSQGAQSKVAGYAEKAQRPDELLYDRDFLDDIRQVFGPEADSKTSQELVDMWLDAGNFREARTTGNFYGAVGSQADIAGSTPERAAALARLRQARDQYPNFYEEGGRGLRALPSIAKGAILDETNLIPLAGSYAKVGKGLLAAKKAGEAYTMGRAVKEGVKRGAMLEGGMGAASEAIASTGDQGARIDLGLQEGFSYGKVAQDALIGATFGMGVGAILGGAAGSVAKVRVEGAVEKGLSLGYQPEELYGMSLDRLMKVVNNDIPPSADTIAARSMNDIPAEEMTPEQVAAAEQKAAIKARFPQLTKLQSHLDALRQTHAEYKRDVELAMTREADEEVLAEIRKRELDVRRALAFAQRLELEPQQIILEEGSNLEGAQKKARARATAFENDMALLDAYTTTDVPENYADDIRARLDARAEIERKAQTQQQSQKPKGQRGKRGATPATAPTQTATRSEPAAPEVQADTPAPEGASETPPASQSEGVQEREDQVGVRPEPSGYINLSEDPEFGEYLADLADQEAEELSVTPRPAPEVPPPSTQARNTDTRLFADENFIDLSEITPSGANGKITKTDIRKMLQSQTTEQQNERAQIERAFSDVIDRLNQIVPGEGRDYIAQNPEVLARLAYDHAVKEYGIKSSDELYAKTVRFVRATSAKSDDPDEARAAIKLSKSEAARVQEEKRLARTREIRIRKMTKELMDGNPDLPEIVARDQARMAADRADQVSNKGDVRSAQSAIERKSIYSTEDTQGKIQSFMRPGRAFNVGTDAEYSLDRSAVPSDSATAFATRVTKGEADIIAQRTNAPAAYIASRRTKVADSSTEAKKGDILWVSPNTTKSYRDWRNVYKTLGINNVEVETPQVRKELDRVVSQTKDRSTKYARSASEEAIKSFSDGEITSEEMLRRLNRIRKATKLREQSASAQMDTPPLINDQGERLLLRSKKDPKDTILATQSMHDKGLTVQDLLGSQSLDDWEATYVPADTKNTRAAREIAATGRQSQPAARKRVARTAMDVNEFYSAEILPSRLTEEDWRDLNIAADLQLNSEAAKAYIKDRQVKGAGISGEAIQRMIANIELGAHRALKGSHKYHSKWPKDIQAQRDLLGLIQRLYSLRKSIAPDGVALPESDRVAASKEIHKIFGRFGTDQAKMAQEFIERLTTKSFPRFDVENGDFSAAVVTTGQVGDRLGRVSFNTAAMGKGTDVPPVAALYHEMFHWLWTNVMSDADKIDIMDGLSKYYDEKGRFSPLAVFKRSPIESANGRPAGVINALDSAPEFLANQFSMWASQNFNSGEQINIWKRTLQYIKAVFDRYFSKKSIDPDLEPHFAKLLDTADRKAVEAEHYTPDTSPSVDEAFPEPTSAAENIDDAPAPPSPTTDRRTGKKATPAEPKEQKRDGPWEDYMSLDEDQLIELGHEDREKFNRALKGHAIRLNVLREMWDDAIAHRDTPDMAIEAARETIRYLRGSVFTQEQSRRMIESVAKATGGKPQAQRNKTGVFSPYKKSGSGKLAAHGRSKVSDFTNILGGKSVVGISDPEDVFNDPFSEASSLDAAVDQTIHGLEVGTFNVGGNVDETAERLIELYLYGKKVGNTDERAKGSSFSDWMSLAYKALNTSFELSGTRPAYVPGDPVANRNLKKYKDAASAPVASIGKFANLRVGDTLTDKGKKNTFQVLGFVDQDGGRAARLKTGDGNEVIMTANEAASFRRGTRAPNPVETIETTSKNLSEQVKEIKAARSETIETVVSEQQGRKTPPTKPADTAPTTVSVTKMSEPELERVIEMTESDMADRAAEALITKRQTKPIVTSPPRVRGEDPIRKGTSIEDIDDLAETVDEAFRAGDEDVDAWALTLHERNGGNPVIAFNETSVIDAVEREKLFDTVPSSERGVPGNIDQNVREILMGITHRQKRQEYVGRKVALRFLNLADKGQPLEAERIKNLMGFEEDDFEDGIFLGSKNFNDHFRKIATDLEAGEGKWGVERLVEIAARLDGDDWADRVVSYLPEETRTAVISTPSVARKVADDWVVRSVHQRLHTSIRNPIDPPPTGPITGNNGTPDEFISRVIDRVAYLANGMMSGKAAANHKRLTWYGDPFVDEFTPSAFLPKNGIITPSQARFAIDDIRSATPSRKGEISMFVGEDIDAKASPVQFSLVHVGPRTRLSKEKYPSLAKGKGPYGPGVYLYNQAPEPLVEARISESLDEGQPEQQAKLREMFSQLQETQERVTALASGRGPKAQADISAALDKELGAMRLISKSFAEPMQLVVPVVARTKTSFDITAPSAKDASGRPVIADALLNTINSGKYKGADIKKTTNAIDRFISEAAGERDFEITNAALYDGLARAIGKTNTNNLLQAAGYTNIKTPEGNVLFSEAYAKVSTDPAFNREYAAPTDNPINPSGQIANKIVTGEVKTIEEARVPVLLGPISKAEPVRKIQHMVGNAIKGRKPTDADRDAVIHLADNSSFGAMSRSLLSGIFRSNTETLGQMRAHWLAGKFTDYFQSSQQLTQRLLFGGSQDKGPMAVLRSLPDTGSAISGALQRHFRRSTSDMFGTRKFGADQPDSHKRIFKYLSQRGTTSIRRNHANWRAMSAEEQRAAQAISDHLQKTFDTLRSADARIGYIKDYFPQVWGKDKIRKSKDEFIALLEEHYVNDSVRSGSAISKQDARNIAVRTANKLLDDESEGLVMPSRGSSRASSAENLDGSRSIRLDESVVSDRLRDFLEDDLEAIMIKYYDQAGRRLHQIETFGVNSHAAYDYIKVAKEGWEGAVQLLSTNKEFRLTKHYDGDEITFVDTYEAPFKGREGQAVQVVREALEVFLDPSAGEPAARDILMRHQPTDKVTGTKSKFYERRVDAILAAFDDYEGTPNDISKNAERFIDRMMRASNRKAITDDHLGTRFSRAVRNFNSITLLSFTTLTSLGDPVLSLVRSGDMKAYSTAIKRLVKDPVYRDMIHNTGVAMESILHDRLAYLWGAADGKATNAFFSLTGLTPWTDMNRQIAGAVGVETFKAMQQKARQSWIDGQPLNAQPRKVKQAYRMLKRYGLEGFAHKDAPLIDAPEVMDGRYTDERITNPDIARTAVIRFADDAIFAPNPAEIPMWGQTPLGAVIFQLKSFPLMMMRMAREVLYDDVRLAIYDTLGKTPPSNIKGTGDLRRAMWLLTLAPAAGMGSLAVKDYVQGRGGDKDNPTHALRERKGSDIALASALMGDTLKDKDIDALAGWYIEGFTHAAGFGLLLEMIHDVLAQTDNGAYGQVRAASTLFGPTVSAGSDAFNAASGAMDALLDRTPDRNSTERAGARSVAQRIPVLGGIKPVREMMVDLAAGEQERTRARQAAKFTGSSFDFFDLDN